MIITDRLFGGIIILIIGITLFLINLNLIPDVNLIKFVRLWPLLLIFYAIRLMAGEKISPILGALLSLLIIIISLAAIFFVSGVDAADFKPYFNVG